jgi:hypothetical protein
MTPLPPLPPKILNWDEKFFHSSKIYQTSKKILVASGCSFTAATQSLDQPASWPGFVRDRCGFEYCVDLSYPGVGNEYIANAVLNYIHSLSMEQCKEIMVVVMWSGLDRLEGLTKKISIQKPSIDGIEYRRPIGDSTSKEVAAAEVWRSWKNIVFLDSYLRLKNIQYAFTSYVNLLDPPFLPKRDLTPHFFGNLPDNKLQTLKSMPWLHDHQDCMFEYCFKNDDFLEVDLFHPNFHGSLNWSNHVLLPGMLAKEFIQKL